VSGAGVSVVVPVSERPVALDRLYREFSDPLRSAAIPFEFIFVVEPGWAKLIAPVETLGEGGEPIRVLRTARSVGETALLRAGAEKAAFGIVLTLPAYPRIEAGGLLDVLHPVIEGGAAMSVARRWPRRDSWLNRLQNRAFHLLVSTVGGERLNDVACGVRALQRELFEALPLYGDVHRFLPLIARRAGWEVVEVEVPQHPEDRQPRVYGPGVYLRRVLDVVGVAFLMRFTEKPLRFFGLLGIGSALAGFLVLAVLGLQRLQGQALADRPMLLVGALLLMLGVQAVALGLVGEIIVHVNAPGARSRRVVEIGGRQDDPGEVRQRSDGDSVRERD